MFQSWLSSAFLKSSSGEIFPYTDTRANVSSCDIFETPWFSDRLNYFLLLTNVLVVDYSKKPFAYRATIYPSFHLPNLPLAS